MKNTVIHYAHRDNAANESTSDEGWSNTFCGLDDFTNIQVECDTSVITCKRCLKALKQATEAKPLLSSGRAVNPTPCPTCGGPLKVISGSGALTLEIGCPHPYCQQAIMQLKGQRFTDNGFKITYHETYK